MTTSRTSRLALLAVLGALVVVASFVPAASAATQRYASPPPALGNCSSASPCDLMQAVSGASAGDEVIVNPGDYPLAATLSPPAQITIHGVAGRPRPRLLFSAGSGVGLWFGSSLRDVEIDQPTANWALRASSGATVDRVVVMAKTYGMGVSNSTVRNSIAVVSDSFGRAIKASSFSGTNISTLRNVTAINTAPSGVAIEAEAALGPASNAVLAMSNTIARVLPGGAALKVSTDSSGAAAAIAPDHSNWLGSCSGGRMYRC